jgi:mono/diheme cytochrome c family protein
MGKTWKMRELHLRSKKQTASELAGIIALGRGHMPAYQLILGDERIEAVVAYIRELGKK